MLSQRIQLIRGAAGAGGSWEWAACSAAGLKSTCPADTTSAEKERRSRDTKLFETILGISAPWQVARLELKAEDKGVDLWLVHDPTR